MENDKRKGVQLITDELRAALNSQQRLALGELELLGWSLKCVRRPLFQDPVLVVVSDDLAEIGLLDPDGKIVVDNNDGIRADHDAADEFIVMEGGAEPEVAAEADWEEKRKGESPIPDNLDDYLNDDQLQALAQIKNFGWQLKFVRRPLFQQPVAVIINTDGDRLGTLESDGRIELQGNFDLRSEQAGASGEKSAAPVAGKKQVI